MQIFLRPLFASKIGTPQDQQEEQVGQNLDLQVQILYPVSPLTDISIYVSKISMYLIFPSIHPVSPVSNIPIYLVSSVSSITLYPLSTCIQYPLYPISAFIQYHLYPVSSVSSIPLYPSSTFIQHPLNPLSAFIQYHLYPVSPCIRYPPVSSIPHVSDILLCSVVPPDIPLCILSLPVSII